MTPPAGFLTEDSKTPFHPWGFNYGGGPLIEDIWNNDWAKVTKDFREMKNLGANVVRVYYVPPPWVLDLALEHGLRLLIDIPWPKHLCFLESEETRREALQLHERP